MTYNLNPSCITPTSKGYAISLRGAEAGSMPTAHAAIQVAAQLGETRRWTQIGPMFTTIDDVDLQQHDTDEVADYEQK